MRISINSGCHTGEHAKKRNPDTGLLEGFVAVYQDETQLVDDPKGILDPKSGKVRKVEKDFATYWGDAQRQAVSWTESVRDVALCRK